MADMADWISSLLHTSHYITFTDLYTTQAHSTEHHTTLASATYMDDDERCSRPAQGPLHCTQQSIPAEAKECNAG